MTTNVKLDLAAGQFATLHNVVHFPCPTLAPEDRPSQFGSPQFQAALERLRDALQPYASVAEDDELTLKLSLSAHDQAVLNLLLVEELSYQQAMGMTLQQFASDVVAILVQLAAYVEAREAAREIS